MRLTKTLFVLACLPVSVTSLITVSPAASDRYCEGYADQAVNRHRENIELGCRLAGLRWHNNAAGHYIFCKAAKKDFLNRETRKRASQLASCLEAAAVEPAEPEVEEEIEEGLVAEPGEEEVLVDEPVEEVAECKARKVSRTERHESPSEAERLSIDAWQQIVRDTYGDGFEDLSFIREGELTCRADGDDTSCTFSGYPCNG